MDIAFRQSLETQFQLSLDTAITTVVTTVAIYLAFVVLVRVLGPRTLTSLSSFDFACVVAFGAVIGRTALLTIPNLMTGIVALVTLFAMQGVLGVLRMDRRLNRLFNPTPVVLVRNGVLLPENMRRVHVVEDELRQAVRRAGLRGLRDVGLVTMEPNGALSVVPAGDHEPWLTQDLDPVTP